MYKTTRFLKIYTEQECQAKRYHIIKLKKKKILSTVKLTMQDMIFATKAHYLYGYIETKLIQNIS